MYLHEIHSSKLINKNSMKRKLVLFILLTAGQSLFQSGYGKLSLQEVRTASDHVLVIFFTSDTTDVGESKNGQYQCLENKR